MSTAADAITTIGINDLPEYLKPYQQLLLNAAAGYVFNPAYVKAQLSTATTPATVTPSGPGGSGGAPSTGAGSSAGGNAGTGGGPVATGQFGGFNPGYNFNPDWPSTPGMPGSGGSGGGNGIGFQPRPIETSIPHARGIRMTAIPTSRTAAPSLTYDQIVQQILDPLGGQSGVRTFQDGGETNPIAPGGDLYGYRSYPYAPGLPQFSAGPTGYGPTGGLNINDPSLPPQAGVHLTNPSGTLNVTTPVYYGGNGYTPGGAPPPPTGGGGGSNLPPPPTFNPVPPSFTQGAGQTSGLPNYLTTPRPGGGSWLSPGGTVLPGQPGAGSSAAPNAGTGTPGTPINLPAPSYDSTSNTYQISDAVKQRAAQIGMQNPSPQDLQTVAYTMARANNNNAPNPLSPFGPGSHATTEQEGFGLLKNSQDQVDYNALMSALTSQYGSGFANDYASWLKQNGGQGPMLNNSNNPAMSHLTYSGTLTPQQISSANAGQGLDFVSSGGDQILHLDPATGKVTASPNPNYKPGGGAAAGTPSGASSSGIASSALPTRRIGMMRRGGRVRKYQDGGISSLNSSLGAPSPASVAPPAAAAGANPIPPMPPSVMAGTGSLPSSRPLLPQMPPAMPGAPLTAPQPANPATFAPISPLSSPARALQPAPGAPTAPPLAGKAPVPVVPRAMRKGGGIRALRGFDAGGTTDPNATGTNTGTGTNATGTTATGTTGTGDNPAAGMGVGVSGGAVNPYPGWQGQRSLGWDPSMAQQQDPWSGQNYMTVSPQTYQTWQNWFNPNISPMNLQTGGYGAPQMQDAGNLAGWAGTVMSPYELQDIMQQSQTFAPGQSPIQSTYKPGTYTPQTYSAQQIDPNSVGQITTDPLNQYQVNAPQNWSGGAAAQYMDPYMQNVVNTQQQQAIRNFNEAQSGRDAAAVNAGAFGGSRQGVADALANRDLQTQLNQIQAQGSEQAYTNAQQQFQADRAAQMQAQQENLQSLLQTQGLGAQTGLAAQQTNLGAYMQALLANQTAALQAQQLGGQERMFGAQLGEQGAQTASQQQMAAAIASAQQRAALNQQALSGIQGAGSSAANIGNLWNLGFGNQMQLMGQQGAVGANIDQLQQQWLNNVTGNYDTSAFWPYQDLSWYSGLLNRTPVALNPYTQQNVQYNPLSQAIGMATGIGGLLASGNQGGG